MNRKTERDRINISPSDIVPTWLKELKTSRVNLKNSLYWMFIDHIKDNVYPECIIEQPMKARQNAFTREHMYIPQ